MKKAEVTLSFLAATIILSSMLFVPAFAARESVQVTKLVNPVTIDGKWTAPDEWSDTNRISMYVAQGAASTAYVRLKHDADFLYLLTDFVSDKTPASTQTGQTGSHYDHFEIGIDENVNDTNTKCCDGFVDLAWYNGKSTPDPVTPSWVQGAMSYNGTNDPDSTNTHAIYEIAIPMPTFEQNSAVRISVWDWSRSVNMHWPQYKGSWSMAYFGDLVFSEIAVPELPLHLSAVLAASVFVTFFMVRRRARRTI